MTKRYYRGETMRQYVEVRNVDGILVDPDTIIIAILDSAEAVKVAAELMTKDSTGKYSYDYLIAMDAETGKWTTEIKAVKEFTAIEQEAVKEFTAIEQDEFAVMEAI